ncbi:MAG: PLP-dependent aminotransferase family protein, partial [Nonomuraea sp.]|nr:PLP-dependent aminotransferase family protein [Nonomuraea sp.]
VVEVLGRACRLHGDTAGLHVLAEIPEEHVTDLIARARERGVLLDSTERHHHGRERLYGLVIGYGSASLTEVKRGCQILADLVNSYAAASPRSTGSAREA